MHLLQFFFPVPSWLVQPLPLLSHFPSPYPSLLSCSSGFFCFRFLLVLLLLVSSLSAFLLLLGTFLSLLSIFTGAAAATAVRGRSLALVFLRLAGFL